MTDTFPKKAEVAEEGLPHNVNSMGSLLSRPLQSRIETSWEFRGKERNIFPNVKYEPQD